jgi:uncharacterized protein (TIGR03067 family)
VEDEKKALVGEWVCQSSEVNGIKRNAKESEGQTFTVVGDKFTQRDADTGDEWVGTYQIGLSGKQNVIATKITVSGKEVAIRCIYERSGETLKVCSHLLPDGELPTEFSAPDGSKRMHAVFWRDKK